MSVSPFRRLFYFAVALLITLALATPVSAANLKMEAKLVWGSNEPSTKHKPVDGPTAEKLQACFKWKYYYTINNVVADIPSREERKLKMSDKCTVKIRELEGPKIEVTLIGNGTPVSKAVKQIAKGELITIGGDAENKSAWFICLTQLE